MAHSCFVVLLKQIVPAQVNQKNMEGGVDSQAKRFYCLAPVLHSLGPVVNILAIFSNANILKNKRIKIYHIKGIGCPLLISINIFTKERKNKKRRKNDQTGTQASIACSMG